MQNRMWLLQKISANDEKSFGLLPGNEYQVGRKGTSLNISWRKCSCYYLRVI